MKHIIIISIFFFSSSLISQTIQVDDKYQMIFVKAKLVPRHGFRDVETYGVYAPEGFKKIKIRLEINTLSGKKESFDPNKFYLVIESEKVRIRPVDFTYHDFLTSYKSFEKLSTEPIKDKYVKYNPEIKDSFYDYKIEGYEDIDMPLNFGSVKKPIKRKTYSKPKKWDKNSIDIYVIIPEYLNSGNLYYGLEKLLLVEVTE